MLDTLDQGSVLYGFRSSKYPDHCCYAIIITASCDIANGKLSKLYYVTAIDAHEWIKTNIGFELIFKDFFKNKLDNLTDLAYRYEINLTYLVLLSDDEISKVLNSCVSKQRDKNKLEEFIRLLKKKETDAGKCEIIQSEKPRVVSFFQNLNQGKITHYYYLPKSSYTEDSNKGNGLIVDFQEIASLSFEDAQRIISPGIDYQCLPEDNEMRDKTLEMYWLNSDADFVALDGTIKSPCREHLMQRFSHAFIRIGLDGATEKDFTRLVESI